MTRYLYLKIVFISSFILFLIVLKVSYVNAQNNTLENSVGNNSKVEIKDYGVRGHLFPIIEESLLEVIMSRLKIAEQNGVLATMQEEFNNRVKQKISRPTPVAGLSKVRKNRSWHYDPSFVQKTDIKDQKGNVVIHVGTSVNPLDKISWGESLIFIDGDDQQQINWAKSKIGKLILINGSPIELIKKLNKPVFFDQGGVLTTRFKIKAVPATIQQEGKLLKISEVKIN
ncbi:MULTISPECIES: type-F conjugative transfer system protein TraW [spotted fever group]|uniref:Conjugal transfer pilus assembly protein TraW n=1 Tax=Rickettsia tamurae subsp. buchneri TaxID=1462938 RepID=A0A8E0WMB8_9RICK|nr:MULTISPECIES: type-F conjugative transfer system protein TraW [spotted fever group]KDO03243.1 conjugal transfer pilus assembly protein TraW [Rickettsia tamurae subsp. buchneri]